MTTMLDLPRDLLEEILSRLPLTDVKAVRSTCKDLNSLTKTQIFANLHIVKEARLILLIDEVVYTMSIKEASGDPHKETLDQVKRVFHCKGLLLCILKDNSKVLVWNPYLGQTRWIEPRFSRRACDREMFHYALGYANKSHKLLRFYDWVLCPSRNLSATRKRFQWCEVYSFDSAKWKTIDFSPDWYVRGLSVTVNGNGFFCATKNKSENRRDLLCFDFTSERFGPLLPFPFSAGNRDMVTLSSVREEKLAVSLRRRSNRHHLEIWLTSKIESEEVVWMKFINLNNTSPEFPIAFGGFWIDKDKKYIIGFDSEHRLNLVGEDGRIFKTWIVGDNLDWTSHLLCSYSATATVV